MDDDNNHHLARETDAEVFVHQICTSLTPDRQPPLIDMMREIGAKFDGAYSMVFLDALGDMIIARDPLGLKPLCYAVEGPLVAAASESVALMNIGFAPESIKPVPPGQAIIISNGRLEIQTFMPSTRRAHCFFEWVYFANVASTLDNCTQALSPFRGAGWARSWPGWRRCPSTMRRSSCRCPTRARRRPTRWPMP